MTLHLWGGLSGHGVDCSALVHLSYRSIGLIVPRDAHDQAASGRPVPLPEARAGDPLFFENDRGIHHVALATGPGRMLHSPRTGTPVREEGIDSPLYAGERILPMAFYPSRTMFKI